MNCYDCGSQGRLEAAVGACVSCGAGVCADHLRTEEQRLQQHATIGNPVQEATRKLLCASCDQVLAHRPLDSVG